MARWAVDCKPSPGSPRGSTALLDEEHAGERHFDWYRRCCETRNDLSLQVIHELAGARIALATAELCRQGREDRGPRKGCPAHGEGLGIPAPLVFRPDPVFAEEELQVLDDEAGELATLFEGRPQLLETPSHGRYRHPEALL